jgi:bacteriorhodopsin
MNRYFFVHFVAFAYLLSVSVLILMTVGATPSLWTVALIITASAVLAYMTKPEGGK